MRLIAIILLSFVYSTVTDIDGNVYETVLIGEQVWMAENLKATHYRNGDEIPTILISSDWGNLSTGAYSVYDITYSNNPSNADIYGNLYNWYTVDDNRGVCPENWHVPSDADYAVLIGYLGGEYAAGGKMKETGLNHWNSPNAGATNESGFTGLPAGIRDSYSGGFNYMGQFAYLWSTSTDINDNLNASYWKLNFNNINVDGDDIYRRKNFGHSIRCLQDDIEGCTNPYSPNYDESANVDDDSCLSATLNVPENFATIQEAIDYSTDGDTVFVAAGTYYENINFYATDITIIGENNITTIIDGEQNSSVISVLSGDGTPTIENFTITNGHSSEGGGLRINTTSLILKNLIIKNNISSSWGGGIYYLSGHNLLIENCKIFSNSVNGQGGGIYSLFGDAVINNSIFYDNSAVEGGALSVHKWGTVINNCIIYNNTSINSGALFLGAGNHSQINNTILFNNYPNQITFRGNEGPATLSISYSDLDGGQDMIANQNNGNINWLDGNIDTVPLFTNADNGDYTLQSASPCIDAGDPNSEYDPDGTIADMGAYYYHQTLQLGDLTQDFQINVIDIVYLVDTVIDIFENSYIPTEQEIEFGDITQDGQLNVIDIVGLVNIILEQ